MGKISGLRSSVRQTSYNIPQIFYSVAKFATRHTSTQTVVADADCIVLVGVGKIVVSFGHRTDKYANTFFGSKVRNVISNANDRSFIAEGDFPTERRQMIGDGVLDDLEKLFLRVHRPNGKSMQKLYHETGESLERSWNSDGGIHLDENSFGGVYIDLQLSCFINR